MSNSNLLQQNSFDICCQLRSKSVFRLRARRFMYFFISDNFRNLTANFGNADYTLELFKYVPKKALHVKLNSCFREKRLANLDYFLSIMKIKTN